MSTSPFSSQSPSGLDRWAFFVKAASVSVSSPVHPSCWFRWCCTLASSIHAGSCTLFTSSTTGLPEPQGKNLEGGIPFRAECSESLIIIIISSHNICSGSLYLYIRKSLEVILL